MAQEFIYYLNGGMNTSDDPSLLKPNQLAETTGMEYRPPRRGLYATLGRSKSDPVTTLVGNRVHGVIWAGSEDNSDKLIVVASGSIYADESIHVCLFGSAKKTGLTQGATAFADGVHYGNMTYVYNGTDTATVITSGLVALTHGMQKTTATGSIATATGATDIPAGRYELWWIEGDDSGSTPLNKYSSYSNFTTLNGASIANVVTAQPAAAGSTWTFTRGGLSNSGTTDNWYIYSTVAGGKFPIGFRQAQIESGVSTGTVTTISTTTPYRISGPLGGVAVSSDDPPPPMYCATVFQDSMVAIDGDNRSQIRYSLPNEPHSWPSINVMRPGETRLKDNLNALATVNGVLVVFSGQYGMRITDLPRHTDGESILTSTGRVIEQFVEGHGCTSPRGVATFQIPGGGELCAFICWCGIHVTDGFSVGYASSELDWYATVDLPSLKRSTLKNNPKKHRIEFYYADASSSTSWKRLDFYYHPKFIDQDDDSPFPRLPILGPTDVPGPAVAVGLLNDSNGNQLDWQVWCGNDNAATVWTEASGTSDGLNLVDANGTINKRWKSRDFYFADVDGEFQISRVYTHQSQTSASGTCTLTLSGVTDDLGGYTATSTIDFSLKGAQPHNFSDRAQHFSLRAVKDDGGTWQEFNYVIFLIEGASSPLASAKSSS